MFLNKKLEYGSDYHIVTFCNHNYMLKTYGEAMRNLNLPAEI